MEKHPFGVSSLGENGLLQLFIPNRTVLDHGKLSNNRSLQMPDPQVKVKLIISEKSSAE